MSGKSKGDIKYICPRCGEKAIARNSPAFRSRRGFKLSPKKCPACDGYILRMGKMPATNNRDYYLEWAEMAVLVIGFVTLIILSMLYITHTSYTSGQVIPPVLVLWVAAMIILQVMHKTKQRKVVFVAVDKKFEPLPLHVDARVALEMDGLKNPDESLYECTTYDFKMDNGSSEGPVMLLVIRQEGMETDYILGFLGAQRMKLFEEAAAGGAFTMRDYTGNTFRGKIVKMILD